MYVVVTTGAPSTRIAKIKRVGHGLKSSVEMWQRVSHVQLERLGTRVLNSTTEEDKHHWAYIFVKSARRDVLKVGVSAAAGQAEVVDVMSPLLIPEEEVVADEDESSDDSSEGDLVDSEDESEEEEEEILSDVDESQAS